MVCHTQRNYNEDWLGGTFSSAVFVGNGLMAILSGVLAHTLVEGLGAPQSCALPWIRVQNSARVLAFSLT
jgi:hypothetical protein